AERDNKAVEFGVQGIGVKLSSAEYRKLMRWVQATQTVVALKVPDIYAKQQGLKDMLDSCIEMDRHWVGAVVFADFCLEAFVYDYAATHLGDGFAHNFIERLELKTKWVLVPKLVTGKDFPRDTQAFQHLSDLVTERNKLAHTKSKPIKSFPQFLKELCDAVDSGKYSLTEQQDLNPYQTVIEVLTELKKLDSDTVKSDWWKLEEV
ncbi:MAG: hypothetical protein ACYS30_07695, partial [Planctomycetota bacterium]